MNRARILVVDDEAANRALVRKVLEPLGYTVAEAADGQEALAAVATQPPDLLLLDLEMPRVDGLAVARAIKSNERTRPHPGRDDHVPRPDRGEDPRRSGRGRRLPVQALQRVGAHGSGEVAGQPEDVHRRAGARVEGRGVRSPVCVESRDRYTGNHCKRLGAYAARVGRMLGLGEEDLRTLHLGGVLTTSARSRSPT
jgi:CheY-like chemotaxis protein